ncbi:hypothetical protein, partial [Burkholderia ubonensis]|uniref:hypothetical protein n=1 Tax=Burkholderia ubonensis TaxID=101571 RepID=UPI001E526685
SASDLCRRADNALFNRLAHKNADRFIVLDTQHEPQQLFLITGARSRRLISELREDQIKNLYDLGLANNARGFTDFQLTTGPKRMGVCLRRNKPDLGQALLTGFPLSLPMNS